jgi:hypothetical protein
MWLTLTLSSALLPLVALASFLGLGAIYFFSVHRNEPFTEKLGAVLLYVDWPWIDSFAVAYQFIGARS